MVGLVVSYVVWLRNKCDQGEKPPNIGGSRGHFWHMPPPPPLLGIRRGPIGK